MDQMHNVTPLLQPMKALPEHGALRKPFRAMVARGNHHRKTRHKYKSGKGKLWVLSVHEEVWKL